MNENNTINPEEVTTEDFTNMIIDSCETEECENKGKVKRFAKNISKKFEEYKSKAIEMLENAEKLDHFLERVEEKLTKLGPAGKKLAYVPEMIMLIRSYVIKEYTDISMAEIIAIIAALIYFVSPFDVFADVIPGLGLLDDVLVMTVVISWCDEDITRYMEWRKCRQ